MVVVGGGPVGCHAAAGLARLGYRVLVIEEHPEIGLPARCTGLIGEEAFQRFDLPSEPTQRIVNSVSVFGPRGAAVRYAAPRPLARVVHRPRFDAALAARAREAGAALKLGTRVTAVDVTPHGCTVALAPGSSLRARAAVIATGGRSPLPAQLGLGRLPRFIFGAQVEVPVEGVEEVEVYLGKSLCPGSFAWVVPSAPGHARIGLMAYDRPAARLARFLQDDRLRPRLGAVPPPPAVAPIPLGTLPATAAERVLVVGEAAGQVKTTTGGGVYFGLLAAAIAVDVLTGALADNDLRRERLAAYDRRWRAIIGHEISMGLQLRRWAQKLDDPAIAFFLNLAARNGVMETVRRLGTFDWHAPVIRKLFGERDRSVPATSRRR
ncbi:MAG: NAD(P)/FAD-dependent oxidoreductase [Desulfotomaculales bacterium]